MSEGLHQKVNFGKSILFIILVESLMLVLIKVEINRIATAPWVFEILKCGDETPNLKCSKTKPLFCKNSELINSCTSCGCLEGMICQEDGACVKSELGEKIYILESGKPEEKIDLLFIPANISDFPLFGSKIKDVLYKEGTDINNSQMISLLTIEPFKTHKDKFNVSYIDKNIDQEVFQCSQQKPGPSSVITFERLHFFCNHQEIEQAYKIFNPDYIAVIFDYPLEYSSSAGPGVLYLNINLESNDRFEILGWTFVHEFGHLFGGLADEYLTTQTPSYNCGLAKTPECFEEYEKKLKIYPNLDTLGCPKWCQSYDLNQDSYLIQRIQECSEATDQEECKRLGGSWFELNHPFFNTHCVPTQSFDNIGKDCLPETSCIFGGDYGQLAFNSDPPSIMGGGLKFVGPSKTHLELFLECCYPRRNTDVCETFRNQFKEYPLSLYPTLKNAYEKIISCP